MTKPANASRGEVALNEAGDGIVLRFSVDAMERLHSEYGEKYVDDVIKKASLVDPKAIKIALECMIENPPKEFDLKGMPWGLTWSALNEKLVDAIMLAIHGRTMKEHQAHLEKEADKIFEDAKTNPRKAAALFSRMSAELGTLPNSDRSKSDN